MIRRRGLLAGAACIGVAPLAAAQSFDHGHAAWSELLKKHVVLLQGGKASQVRYAAMAQDRDVLRRYLASLSAVGRATFDAFPRPQQMAFLINAYNAFTVELILTRYPKLDSIKDLGSLFQSPWKQKFVPLLGSTVTLDHIEHDVLRAKGRYDDPRIHFAVNCASIGCPMLREEAYAADRLDVQLDEQARRFLSDRSRNRWSVAQRRAEVSKIFDWYGDDFRQGHRGIASLEGFLAGFAEVLADAAGDRELLRAQRFPISFLDYDWGLNDAK